MQLSVLLGMQWLWRISRLPQNPMSQRHFIRNLDDYLFSLPTRGASGEIGRVAERWQLNRIALRAVNAT